MNNRWIIVAGKMRSEYFPTFQCTKRVKLNLLISLQKFKKDNVKFFYTNG